jgi:hypothetical protein
LILLIYPQLKKATLVLFILLNAFGAFAKNTVIVISTPHDVYYFEVGKLMKGARIEIYDPAGKLISSQDLIKRKLIVELPELFPGEYIVKIKKESADQLFDYHGNGKAKVSMRDELTVSLKLETAQEK